MSEQSPYEKLEVSEDASFEEIQAARDRLIAVAPEDEKRRQSIEAAYDAVLMDRLRQRQEGRIKVPERIRFPERLLESPPSPSLPRVNQSPQWLQRLIDTPDPKEVLLTGGVYAALAAASLFWRNSDALAFLLALGVGFNLVWINRKERKLGRAFLLTLAGLVAGGLIAVLILQTPLMIPLLPEAFVSLVVFLIFWLISSFLR